MSKKESSKTNINENTTNNTRIIEPQIIPKNDSQNNALKSFNNPNTNYTFLLGPAGTGKSLLATIFAIKKFIQKEYKKIVITRPAVTVDEDHGFLPGSIQEKLNPYMLPILDIFMEFFDVNTIEQYMNEGRIEIAPLAYMRGRNLGPILTNDQSTDKRGFIVIADEMQNSTPEQMKMLLTRLGENGKMIITGDPEQHDRGLEHNGLQDFIKIAGNKNSKSVDIIRFSKDESVRSKAVTEILDIYGS